MYKAVIFDLDGTLADTITSIAYFANKALNKFDLCYIDIERYKYLVGNGADELVRKMLFEHSAYTAELFNNILNEYRKSYNENFLYKTTAYNGIVALLNDLKAHDFKLAVLSNKPNDTTQKVVKALFGDIFDVCYGHVEGVPKKPDPKAALMIARELGVAPAECMYVGDTDTDMKTGKSAGMLTVGVLWGFRDFDELSQNGADIIVSKPKEILAEAIKWNKG